MIRFPQHNTFLLHSRQTFLKINAFSFIWYDHIFAENRVIRPGKWILTKISRNLTFIPRYTISNHIPSNDKLQSRSGHGSTSFAAEVSLPGMAATSNDDDTSGNALRRLARSILIKEGAQCSRQAATSLPNFPPYYELPLLFFVPFMPCSIVQ